MFENVRRRAFVRGLIAAAIWPFAIARPSSAQEQDADIDAGALVGVWRGTERTGGIIIGGEVIFYADGGYRRMHRLGYLETWDVGSYRIARNWIHFDIEDYEPKYYQGVFQHKPPSETWRVSRFDGRVIAGWIGEATRFNYARQ